MRKRVKYVVKILPFILSIIAIFLIFHLGTPTINIDVLAEFLRALGPFGVSVTLILMIISSIIGLIFALPIAAATIIYDFYLVVAMTYIGLLIGSLVTFYLSRKLLRNFFEKRFSNNPIVKKYNHHLEKNGILMTIFFRIILLIPFELVNIGAGLSKIKFKDYLIGTIFGIIPCVVVNVYFIKNANSSGYDVLLPLLVNVCFSIIPLFSRRVRDLVFE
jgi:uncharacterized membrane protein YdjX (TVP38/TMEM64 family)